MDTALLQAAHTRRNPQDAVLQRAIEMSFKGGLDLRFEMNGLGIVGRHFVLCLDFPAWPEQRAEDHPKRLGERRSRKFVLRGKARQSAVPGGASGARGFSS